MRKEDYAHGVMRTKIKIIFIILFLLLCGVSFYNYATEHYYSKSVLTKLRADIFSVFVPDTITVKGTRIIMDNIALDPQEFSTISHMKLSISPLNSAITELEIEELNLVGELEDSKKINISGIEKSIISLLSSLPAETDIQAIKLDLATSQGGIRIEGKLKITKDETGTGQIAGILWANQHQLEFNAQVKGTISSDNHLLLNMEINDGRINFADIFASRISGWSDIYLEKNLITSTSGQLNIGAINFSGIPFLTSSLIWQNESGSSLLILNTQGSGIAPVDINAEYQDNQMMLSFESTKKSSLLSFMTSLYNNLQSESLKQIKQARAISNIIGTADDRILLEKTLKSDSSYDSLIFQVEGPLDDLSAKIIAQELFENSTKQHVIRYVPDLD
jgi:hypothetical protein